MTGISSLGVGSGLDLNSLVQQLVTAERAPVENRLNRSQAKATSQLSALGQLRSATNTLGTAVNNLKDFQTALKANITGGDAVSVQIDSAGPRPEQGSWQIRVDSLASAQSLASDGFADPAAALGSGTLSIQIGDATTAIQIAPGADLRAVRDAINASGARVQAVVVPDGAEHKLLLSARDTGTAGAMQISVSGGLDGRLASAAMIETAPAADAQFSVNGLALTASSNQLTDVLPGLTLRLERVSGAGATTVSVSQDRDAVRSRLNTLAAVYNSLQDVVRNNGRYDPATGSGGPLLGDPSLRAVQSQLGGAFSRNIPGLGDNAYSSMQALGFSADINGKVSLDAQKLDTALREDPAAVERLLGAFAETFGSALQGYAGQGGVLESRLDSLNNQLKRIDEQRVALDRRMAAVEQRLRNQFSALDAMVAQFSRTSAFLEDQLSNLADLRPGRNR